MSLILVLFLLAQNLGDWATVENFPAPVPASRGTVYYIPQWHASSAGDQFERVAAIQRQIAEIVKSLNQEKQVQIFGLEGLFYGELPKAGFADQWKDFIGQCEAQAAKDLPKLHPALASVVKAAYEKRLDGAKLRLDYWGAEYHLPASLLLGAESREIMQKAWDLDKRLDWLKERIFELDSKRFAWIESKIAGEPEEAKDLLPAVFQGHRMPALLNCYQQLGRETTVPERGKNPFRKIKDREKLRAAQNAAAAEFGYWINQPRIDFAAKVLIESMTRTGQNKAALIYGEGHTEDIIAKFNTLGYDLVVVKPRLLGN